MEEVARLAHELCCLPHANAESAEERQRFARSVTRCAAAAIGSRHRIGFRAALSAGKLGHASLCSQSACASMLIDGGVPT